MKFLFAFLLFLSPANAIVNGFKVPDHAPFAPAIVHVISNKGQNCTGTLIRANVVLTAAHCVFPAQKQSIVWRDNKGKRNFIRVRASAIHPDYVPFKRGDKQWSADLALMHLGKSVPENIQTPFIRPLSDLNTWLHIAGRGKRKFADKTLDFELYDAVIPLAFHVKNKHMVLRGNGRGACSGDSGGPVFLRDHVVGVIMIASDDKKEGCGFNTIALILEGYFEWINKEAIKLQTLR